jgi:hypothetical protein
MTEQWMIYGANGYTGRLAARVAKDRVFTPILAGRRVEQIQPLARDLGFESRIFDLADSAVVARNLEGVTAVLHLRRTVLRDQQTDTRRMPARQDLLSRYHRRDCGVQGHSFAQQGFRHGIVVIPVVEAPALEDSSCGGFTPNRLWTSDVVAIFRKRNTMSTMGVIALKRILVPVDFSDAS